MKKILITTILFFILSINPAFAQENAALDTNSQASESAFSYSLPYPGLLPDNPLYYFKTLRDKFIRMLISDPLKKSAYDLLQADKKVNAGYYLVLKNNGKDKLVATAVSEGENYFESSLKEILKAKEQGADISDLSKRLVAASKKHQEVLVEIKTRINKENKSTIEKELKRVQSFEKMAIEIKP